MQRLERRAAWLEQRVEALEAKGRNPWQDRAEASAIRWLVAEVRLLDETVDRMPGEIAEWLSRNLVPEDELDESGFVCADCRCNPELDPPCRSCGGRGVVGWQGDGAIREAAEGIAEIDWRGHCSAVIHSATAESEEIEL